MFKIRKAVDAEVDEGLRLHRHPHQVTKRTKANPARLGASDPALLAAYDDATRILGRRPRMGSQ